MMKHKINNILVCIDAHPKAGLLLRAGLKKARSLNQGWTVLYVETPDHYAADSKSRERTLQFLTMAEEMGAQIARMEGQNVEEAILRYMHESKSEDKQITQLIIGQSHREGLWAQLQSSIAERVARKLRNHPIEVQIIPLSGVHYSPKWYERLQLARVRAFDIIFAVTMVLLAYGAAELMRSNLATIEWQVNRHNIAAFFLIASVVTSMRCGLIAGLLSAAMGFTVINYFYIPPLHNFRIAHSADSIGLVVFLLSAVLVALMGAYSRASQSAIARKERRSQALYEIHRIASQQHERDKVLPLLHAELSRLLEMEIAFFLPGAANPHRVELAYPNALSLSEKAKESLEACWHEVRASGLGTLVHSRSSWRFEPMVTNHGEIGVLGVKVPPLIRLDASFGRLLAAMADQIANILERIELVRMMSESQVREEREKLRAMLLSSVSHDLKTPLASIIGSLSLYRRLRRTNRLEQGTADELTETALEEAQRLDSFITNILDMTRIESGDIQFESEWVSPEQLIKNVEKRLRQRLHHHHLHVVPSDEKLHVQLDPMMTEQILQNIIDNAAKYSPKHTTITVSYGPQDGGFAYKVKDEGPGIPEDKKEAIFDKYERLRQSDSQVAGTGLGLAISRAVLEKQGGHISVRNHEKGGAEFSLWFPHCRAIKRSGAA
jgi:two-component system sensor histidine kinase KdpD